jgi:hypothetical protein
MKDRIIYQLTVEDLQTVANDYLNRKLTSKEVLLLEEELGEYIDWYDIIEDVIRLNIEENGTNSTTDN